LQAEDGIRDFHVTGVQTCALPICYLQRRRIERAMALLRTTDASVTQICFEVGFSSLGTFSRTFRDIVGVSPTDYRHRSVPAPVPTCFTMSWTRPSSFGEAEPAAVR